MKIINHILVSFLFSIAILGHINHYITGDCGHLNPIMENTCCSCESHDKTSEETPIEEDFLFYSQSISTEPISCSKKVNGVFSSAATNNFTASIWLPPELS